MIEALLINMLYIDPGTGSMLFTVVIGILSASAYFFRMAIMKIKFIWSKDKTAKINQNKLPIVIFSDHKRYWNVFEPICDELEKREQTIYYFTASSDDPALSKKYKNIKCEFIGEGNKAYSRMNLLNASIVLSSTPNLDVYQWRRSKLVDYYIHIPHQPGEMTQYRMFGLHFYDAILYSGEYQKEHLQTLFDGKKIPPKEFHKVGITYMDSMLKRVADAPKVEGNGKLTVLLAPSWGPSSIFAIYGDKIIEALLKTDYNIIIRPHPQSFSAEKEMMDAFMTKYPDSDRLSWNRDNDNFDVLNRSDIMISDFSNVMYDFTLVFGKPIIYANSKYDKSVYDAYFLDGDPWGIQVLPTIGLPLEESQFDNIGEVIENCVNNNVYKEGRENARKETWAYVGEAAPRVADYLINKYEKIARKGR